MKFVYEKGEVTAEDRALFTVANRNGTPILRKVLSPNDGDNAFHLPFVYAETAGMKPDSYDWSLRVVRNGVFDTNGRITDAQGVHRPADGCACLMNIKGNSDNQHLHCEGWRASTALAAFINAWKGGDKT